MRRILFPILVIGLTAGLFTLGSGAYFSDEQSSTDNTITAGTFYLVCDSDKQATPTPPATTDCGTANYVVNDAYPGQALDSWVTTLRNNSDTGADIYVHFTFLPVSCVDAGVGSGIYCEDNANLVAGDIDATSAGDVDTGSTNSVFASSITTFAGLPQTCTKVVTNLGGVDGSDTATLTLSGVKIDNLVDNTRQGDRLTISAHWVSIQTGAGAPAC